MSELLSCPFCGGEIRVSVYDEDFYRLVLGADYEFNKDYLIEHIDRMAAAKAKCPFEMATYSTEAEAIDAWNTRAERTCKRIWTGVEMICSACCYSLNNLTARYCHNCGARIMEVGE